MAGNETDQSSFLLSAHPDVRHGTVLVSPLVFVRQVQPAPVVVYVTPASAVTHAHTSLVVVFCVSSTHRPSCYHKNSGANSLPNRDSADLETEAGTHRATVRKPVEIPQLQILDKVTWHARCCAITGFMVLTEQKACGDSTVADLGHARCWFNDRSMVQTVQKPVEIPQLQILDKVTWHARCCATTGFMVLTEQKARGDSTVADLGQGYLTCRSLCNDTCPWSYRAEAREIPQLQILGQGTHRADSAEACGDSTIADLGQSF